MKSCFARLKKADLISSEAAGWRFHPNNVRISSREARFHYLVRFKSRKLSAENIFFIAITQITQVTLSGVLSFFFLFRSWFALAWPSGRREWVSEQKTSKWRFLRSEVPKARRFWRWVTADKKTTMRRDRAIKIPSPQLNNSHKRFWRFSLFNLLFYFNFPSYFLIFSKMLNSLYFFKKHRDWKVLNFMV